MTSVEQDTAFHKAMKNASNTSNIDMQFFSYVIKQKDIIINEVHDKIKLLTSQIDLLNKLSLVENKETDNQQKNDKAGKIKQQKLSGLKTGSRQDHETKTNNNKIEHPIVGGKQLSADIMILQSELKCKELINLTRDTESEGTSSTYQQMSGLVTETGSTLLSQQENLNRNDSKWKSVTHRKGGNRNATVIGNNKEASIKGVRKSVASHVYRIAIQTTASVLQSLLRDSFSEVICESMTSKYPNLYSSFKVTIFEDNFKAAMDPKVWSEGACVNRFFQFRTKVIPEK